LNPTDELTFASNTNCWVGWFHLRDLFAPLTSKPAPSDVAESAAPLASVISLSSILSSETWISAESPNTFKFPLIVRLPVNAPSTKLTLSPDCNPKSTSEFTPFIVALKVLCYGDEKVEPERIPSVFILLNTLASV